MISIVSFIRHSKIISMDGTTSIRWLKSIARGFCPTLRLSKGNLLSMYMSFFLLLFTGRQESTDPQSTSTMSSKQSSNTFCPFTATKLTMNEGEITVNKMQNRKRQREHGENSTPTTHKVAKVPKLNVSICVPICPHFVQYSQSDSLLRPERLRKETVSNRRPGIHFWYISICFGGGGVPENN